MEKIFKLLSREYGNVNQAAILLGLFAFLSQILALLRDRSFAHYIGPSTELDIYYAAFRVPDFIFLSVASLASITVLIPFLLNKMQGGAVTEEARRFLNNIFTVFFFGLILAAGIAYMLMPTLVSLVAPGFGEAVQSQVVVLSRIMLFSPILLGLSNLFGSVTQLFRKFFLYALSPVFYNVGIIVGVFAFYPKWGVSGLALGVVLGAFLHLAVQIYASWDSGFTPRISWTLSFAEVRETIVISFPRTLGLALNSLALLVIVAVASFLSDGSISIFNLSLNLQSVPLGIIGLSYAVAAFPTLSKSFSMGAMDEFKEHLRLAARQIIFWSLPVTFLFIVLRAQIVRVILGSGVFSWEDTRLVAASLALFSVSIVAQGLIALFARAYYARGETERPLVVNFISSLSIVVLSLTFLFLFRHYPFFLYFIESALKVTDVAGTEVLMLPLAYSSGTILNFILLWIFIKRDFMHGEKFISQTFFQSLCASFFVGTVTYLGLNFFSPKFGTETFLGIFFQGLLSGALGISAGVFILHLFKNEELKDLAEAFHTKFWKTRVIAPPQESL
jgi:putative peptidoglycan lipid II flippase